MKRLKLTPPLPSASPPPRGEECLIRVKSLLSQCEAAKVMRHSSPLGGGDAEGNGGGSFKRFILGNS